MIHLTKEDVLLIHGKVVEFAEKIGDPVDTPGVKNINNLESALGRQVTGWAGVLKYPEIRQNAASLMYGVCLGHAFHNGNKRTALLAGMLHLDRNGYCFDSNVSHNDLYDFMKGMAAHDWPSVPRISKATKKTFPMLFQPEAFGIPNMDAEVEVTASWLQQNTRIIDKSERVLTMRNLRANLEKFGVTAVITKNASITFTRIIDERKVFGLFPGSRRLNCNISYRGEGRPIDKKTMKKIRQDLMLTRGDGCDSKSFYDSGLVLDQMMMEHQRLIQRLGKI